MPKEYEPTKADFEHLRIENIKLKDALKEMQETNEVLKQEKQALLTSINNVIAILLNTKKV